VVAARTGGPVIVLGADAPHVSARALVAAARALERAPTSCSGQRPTGATG